MRPNLIIINIDDMGWTDVGCFGTDFYETPNIDRLASQGMKFTNAYAACAVCSPTRASQVTGRYPARYGITDWIRARFQGGEIPADKRPPNGYVGSSERRLLCPENGLWLEHSEKTAASMLREAGYVTCHIGKWHLGAEDWFPEKHGYDINMGGCDLGQPLNYFDPYTDEQLPNGIVTLPPRVAGEYLTDREADEAEEFIRGHKDGRFFLSLNTYAVHTPIQAKQDLIEKYNAKEKGRHKDPVYAGMVESVDDAVGRVMEVLDDTGLADNTLVMFTSDNGGVMGITDMYPLRGQKGDPYEGGIRVPQIARWPGVIKPGLECGEPVTSVDFLPTMLAAAGVDLPTDRDIDGVDIGPLLRGKGPLEERALFWHYPHYRKKDIPPYSIVRRGNWKLIRRWGDGKSHELYNLADDISETNDLADCETKLVGELDADALEWCERTDARLPKENPEYAGLKKSGPA